MSLKFTAITSLVWKFPERVGSQGVQFSVAIVLTRLLSSVGFRLIAFSDCFCDDCKHIFLIMKRGLYNHAWIF